MTAGSSLSQTRRRFPPQVRYIVGNEACERFSYYGMRAILVVFLTHTLGMAESSAKGTFHYFVSASYFLALFGGYLADRHLGKYRTILYLSLFYCLGHGVLAIWEDRVGVFLGLGLIALGAGGVKPCVSAFVGDQFGPKDRGLLDKVFELFYWAINVGAFASALLTPWILPRFGPRWAFGVPGILMGVATLIFWLGRKHYVVVPATGAAQSSQFFALVWYAATHQKQKTSGQGFLDVAAVRFGAERVEGAKAAVGVFKVFIWVIAFWALFDQQGSSWVIQGERLDPSFLGFRWEASQMQALNSVFVLAFIPIFSYGVYPLVERLGIKLTPLRKMGTGMATVGLSFVTIGLVQVALDHGHTLSIGWQVLAYFFLSVSEIMVSITGLEFAYTQAPPSMKSTLMSLWFLTIALGNFLAATVSLINPFQGSLEFFFYAGLTFAVSVVFIYSAICYQEREFLVEA